MIAELLSRIRDTEDPELRTQLARQLAFGTGDAAAEDIDALVELLTADEDPDVQAWVTVSLRRLQHDPRVESALRSCFRDRNERESVRVYALAALEKINRHVDGEELRELYETRRSQPDDLLLTTAVRGIGRHAATPLMLRLLLDIQGEEARQDRRSPKLRASIAAAVTRCARNCLAAGAVTPQWFAEAGRTDVLDRLGETRMQRLIAERRAQLQQPPLLGALDVGNDDVPLVPGLPLADFQDEQYAEDLAEMKVEFVEKRSFIRDQSLARTAKKDAGYACQVCGERLDSAAQRHRFVQVHHIQPLSEGGADTAENMVTICPTCHGKVHAGALSIRRENGALFVRRTGDPTPYPLACREGPGIRDVGIEPIIAAQIVAQMERLAPERRERVLRDLCSRFGGPPVPGEPT